MFRLTLTLFFCYFSGARRLVNVARKARQVTPSLERSWFARIASKLIAALTAFDVSDGGYLFMVNRDGESVTVYDRNGNQQAVLSERFKG